MSQISPRLNLPFLQPAQAQKHVTHNEALRQLDLVVQLTITSLNAITPPSAPSQGEIHALGAAPTGDWSGQAGNLAAWIDNGWSFVTPVEGWRAWDSNSDQMKVWDGSDWIDPPVNTQNLTGVGVATNSDSTNRLSVRSPATLLSHDGGGHQLKINKASSGDTASLLFQSNWTGHAEMGLSGDTGFTIKVSPDGGNWTEAMRFDPASGVVSGAAVQSSADDISTGRLMRADYGYGPGNVLGSVSESSGTPTGSVIERGSTSDGEFVRFADGTQICTAKLSAVDCTANLGPLFTSTVQTWSFPATFAAGSETAISGSGGGLSRFLSVGAASDSQVDVQVISAISDTTTLEPTLVAVGRWF